MGAFVRRDLESFGVEVVDAAAGLAGQPPVASVLVTEGSGARAVVDSPGLSLPADAGEAARFTRTAGDLYVDLSKSYLTDEVPRAVRSRAEPPSAA